VGPGAVPGLDRPRGAERRADEIDTVEALESFRRDTGAAEGCVLPYDRRHRPNGAIRALPVTRKSTGDQQGDLLLIDPARNMRTEPPTSPAPSRRDAQRMKCATASPRAARPYRDSARGVPGWLNRRAARHPGAAVSLAGGVDYEHGTATASAAISRCMRDRRGSRKLGTTPLKRGMILSNEPATTRPTPTASGIENLEL